MGARPWRAGRRWVVNLQGVSGHEVVSEALEGVAGEHRGGQGSGDAAGGSGGGGGEGVDYRTTRKQTADYSLVGRCRLKVSSPC